MVTKVSRWYWKHVKSAFCFGYPASESLKDCNKSFLENEKIYWKNEFRMLTSFMVVVFFLVVILATTTLIVSGLCRIIKGLT